MSSLYAKFATASRIEPNVFLFCGADPCWTPAREARVLSEACYLCGGPGGKIADGDLMVCAKCMRYGQDHRLGPATEPETKAVELDELPRVAEPGYVAKRARNGARITLPERFASVAKP